MKKTLKKLPALLIALVAGSAYAHNIWIEPSSVGKPNYVVKFGHEQTESYPQAKLKSVQAVDEKGQINHVTYKFDNGEAHFQDNGQSLILLQFDNGIWSKLPSGKYVEKSKAQEPTAEFSINPIKMGKAILKWDQQAFATHNLPYELIPQGKPEAGKPLAILVLQNGQPVQGIKVGLGEDHPFNLSNEKGIAEFTPSKGYNKVWAEFEEDVANNPDYDKRSVEYMLTFDVQ